MTVAESQFFTTEQLASRYGKTPQTIRKGRYKGYGPEFYELSKLQAVFGDSRVRYELHKVLAWEEANGITPIEPF